MKVGIIGSGGREHAICQALNNTKRINQIYCFPGNAGTAEIAKNVSLNVDNFNDLKEFIILNKIDLIIVGPEKPLVDGIVDFLEDNNIKVLVQTNLLLNSKAQKFLQKTYAKNIIYQLQNLVFFKKLVMQHNL